MATFGRESLTEELHGSLRRLGVETIDLYQIHWPDPEDQIEAAWEQLARFREEGKVRWIGVSNFNVDQMKRIQKIAPITSLQPPYSMLRRAAEETILPFAHASGIGVINYSPMLSGMLAGKMTAERVAALPADDWRRKNVEFSEPRLSRNLRLVELLREIGSGHGVSPGVVAVAWTLHNPAITGAIVGGRSAKQVEETARPRSRFGSLRTNSHGSTNLSPPIRHEKSVARILPSMKRSEKHRDYVSFQGAQTRTPAVAGVLSIQEQTPLHRRNEVRNHGGCVFLQ